MKVASKYAGRGLTFSVASKKDFLSELEEDFGLGLSDGGELPVITIRTRTGHKYTMREEFTYVAPPPPLHAGPAPLTRRVFQEGREVPGEVRGRLPRRSPQTLREV